MDPSLDHSYEACRRMQRRHDPTYYWATRRLPAEIRPGVRIAIGLYVRMLDRVEAAGFDVLRRSRGVRAWDLPAAVVKAL